MFHAAAGKRCNQVSLTLEQKQAVVAEVAADKIPAVDHLLDAIQAPVRTLAGMLVAAAVATTFAPPSLGPFRFAIAALVLMPVPSVCVQYALDHDADAVTATATRPPKF